MKKSELIGDGINRSMAIYIFDQEFSTRNKEKGVANIRGPLERS